MDEKKIPLERVIVKEILDWLKSSGYWCYKSHGNAYARTGLPDIVVIDRNGRFVGMECKRPKVGRLTLLQAKILNQINESGGFGQVVRSREDAEAALAASEAGETVKWRFVGNEKICSELVKKGPVP